MDYLQQANDFIKRFGKLNIIYLRVSTKNKGQREQDQLPEILTFFNLKKEHCIIIAVQESAFQIKQQDKRSINEIIKLIQILDKDIEKNIYFYSIDRIYRNRELMEEFYNVSKKSNTSIYSFFEYFINELADVSKKLPEGMGWLIESQQRQLINFFAWMGEMESKKIGKRLKKSLSERDGRTFSNKGRLYGSKLKDLKGNLIRDVKRIDKIERAICFLINKDISYTQIQIKIQKLNVKVSVGFITKIKKKYGLR